MFVLWCCLLLSLLLFFLSSSLNSSPTSSIWKTCRAIRPCCQAIYYFSCWYTKCFQCLRKIGNCIHALASPLCSSIYSIVATLPLNVCVCVSVWSVQSLRIYSYLSIKKCGIQNSIRKNIMSFSNQWCANLLISLSYSLRLALTSIPIRENRGKMVFFLFVRKISVCVGGYLHHYAIFICAFSSFIFIFIFSTHKNRGSENR